MQKQLESFPDGKLISTHNGKYTKWYLSDGHHVTFLSKKSRELAEQLALKKYLTLKANSLIHEKNALSYYLQHHKDDTATFEELLSDTSAYADLLTPYFQQHFDPLASWAKESYERNPKNPEHLIYKTVTGDYVRSKSETIIAMFLYMHKIPFRYECAIHLDSLTFYPDFTIRHPRTGEFYYWEHFGFVDNPNYRNKMHFKLEHFISNGILPTGHLITTFETKDQPLNPSLVEDIIKYYFVDK